MATENDHTPGPWATEYRKRKDGMYAQEVFDRDGKTIATCDWYPVQISDTTTATNRAANAALIAAAPEMLAALQAALAWAEPMAEAPASSRPDWFAKAKHSVYTAMEHNA